MRQLVVGAAITLVAFAGTLWQAGAVGDARAAGDLPRLVCPLH